MPYSIINLLRLSSRTKFYQARKAYSLCLNIISSNLQILNPLPLSLKALLLKGTFSNFLYDFKHLTPIFDKKLNFTLVNKISFTIWTQKQRKIKKSDNRLYSSMPYSIKTLLCLLLRTKFYLARKMYSLCLKLICSDLPILNPIPLYS